MFCSNCRKKIADTSKYCQYCGCKIESIISENYSVEDKVKNSDNKEKRNQIKFSKNVSLIITLAVIIGIVIFAIVKIFAGGLFCTPNTIGQDRKTFLSNHGIAIVEKLPDDERIAAYFTAEKILLSIDWSDYRKLEEPISKLVKIAETYNLETTSDEEKSLAQLMEERYKGYYEHENLKFKDYWTEEKIQKEKNIWVCWGADFACGLIGETYAENNEFDYPIKLNLNNLLNELGEYGYSIEKENPKLTHSYIRYDIMCGDQKAGWIDTDLRQNIISIHLQQSIYKPSYIEDNNLLDEYMSKNIDDRIIESTSETYNSLKKLQESDFRHNTFFSILLDDTEAKEIYCFLTNLSYDEIENMYSSNEASGSCDFWCYLQLDKNTVVIRFNDGAISMSSLYANQWYNSKYTGDEDSLVAYLLDDTEAKPLYMQGIVSLQDYISKTELPFEFAFVATDFEMAENTLINDDDDEKTNDNLWHFEGSCDYSIELPEEYNDLVRVESWQDGDCFIDIASEDAGTGGVLFTIQRVLNEELDEALGVYDDSEILYATDFDTIFIGKPTDLEYDETTSFEYESLIATYEQIKESFVFIQE